VQWYEKVPAVLNVWLKLRPGESAPELHAPPSAVDVWMVLSLLVHVTESPTATLKGLGVYAVVVNVDAPLTIATDVA
jgi:hypothetical protein